MMRGDDYSRAVFHEAWRQTVFGIPWGLARRPTMSRLGNYRAGDRSEYLAVFALSRFSFVQPTPRQEDFGLDFLCTLGRSGNLINPKKKKNSAVIYPEDSFFIQIKSDTKPIVLNEDFTRWISESIQLPLFIGVINKSLGGSIAIYSCSLIWKALTLRPQSKSLTLKFSTENYDRAHYTKALKPLDPASDDTCRYEIDLGRPILELTIEDLEKDSALPYRVMKPWIRQDQDNITNRRNGRITTRHIVEWETNKEPPAKRQTEHYIGPDYQQAESALAPTMIALAVNYNHHGEPAKRAALCSFIDRLNLSPEERADLLAKVGHMPPMGIASSCPTGSAGPMSPPYIPPK